MNKYQKAFCNIDSRIISGKGAGQSYVNGQYKYDSRAILELVQKAIPIKPISDYEYEDYWDDGYWETYKREFYACPMCKKELLDNWKGCPHCLQALDWSDIDDR